MNHHSPPQIIGPQAYILLLSFHIAQHIRFPQLQQVTTVKDKWFLDEDGRVRMFRGFNSVKKEWPWYDEQMLNDTKLDFYKEWGFNVVRLGVMWTGVEPQQGIYNESYISILENIIEKLSKRGIYVILDLHQDVLSSRYDTYDGIPLWLLDMLPPPSKPYPYPLKEKPEGFYWAEGYLSAAVGEAFQHIFDNTAEVQDKLGGFWMKIASVFKTHNNVLGECK